MRLSTMRNETITAFQKVFKMLFTYITHVQQSLMLCPKFLSKKIHRITSIMSINYMTPRQPYKITNTIKISFSTQNSLSTFYMLQTKFNIYAMYLIFRSCAIAVLSLKGNNIDKGSV